MNDEMLEHWKSEVAEGELHKGFLVVSESNYWTPWMVQPIQHRIEIGLFADYLGYPRGPSISLNWIVNEYGEKIEVRASPEAWQIFPLLDGISDVLTKVGASVLHDIPSVSDVRSILESSGFVESTLERLGGDELPLPPEEIIPPYGSALRINRRFSGSIADEETKWVGPHIGRTVRFLSLVEKFIANLNERGVAAQDIKAQYIDSAFYRLWEGVDYSLIDESMVKAYGRTSADEVPIAMTDTTAYLGTAVRIGDEGFVRSGGYEGAPELTILAPISEVVFHIYEATDADLPKIEPAFINSAIDVGLDFEWNEKAAPWPVAIVRLPDTAKYRYHAIDPADG